MCIRDSSLSRLQQSEISLEEKDQVIVKLKIEMKSLDEKCEGYQLKFSGMRKQYHMVQKSVENVKEVLEETKQTYKQFHNTSILNMGKTVQNIIYEKMVPICNKNEFLQKKIINVGITHNS